MKINIAVSWYDGEFITGAQCPHVDKVSRCKVRRCYMEPPEQVTDCILYQGGDCLHPAVKRKAMEALAKRIADEIDALAKEAEL